MALPILKSVEDCSNYKLTVEPFKPQLLALPTQLLGSLNSVNSLTELYVQTNPLVSASAFSIFLGFVFVVVSEINRNYSQVDRMWSILPSLYVLHMDFWARLSGLPHRRLDLAVLATVIWTCRLTFNYWRRGGYSVGSEDYRWEIVKKSFSPFFWFLFNVTFIAFTQSFLLFLFSAAPVYVILLSTKFESSITAGDWAYFATVVVLVLSEWISDGQQWTYQTAKYKYRGDGKLRNGFTKADLERGFIASGLFAYSRHPNFFAEQTIWFAMYQWACYSANSLYNWTGFGALALVALFQGSTALTEAITAGKYPEYKTYQGQVGMFIPKSLSPYRGPVNQPKIIKTSDLAKHQQPKEKQL